MSIQSWLDEFYETPAFDVPAPDAVAHSLRKWKGLRPENLSKHGVRVSGGDLWDDRSVFTIDSRSCALCEIYTYREGYLVDCNKTCPLAIVRQNFRCDQTRYFEENCSPWNWWRSQHDPEPMIKWLEQALEYENPRGPNELKETR